jgi:hypothetical protein
MVSGPAAPPDGFQPPLLDAAANNRMPRVALLAHQPQWQLPLRLPTDPGDNLICQR